MRIEDPIMEAGKASAATMEKAQKLLECARNGDSNAANALLDMAREAVTEVDAAVAETLAAAGNSDIYPMLVRNLAAGANAGAVKFCCLAEISSMPELCLKAIKILSDVADREGTMRVAEMVSRTLHSPEAKA